MVAAVLVAGSEKAAAHRLGLSHSTVKHHLANARSKVGATTTAQLVWILAPRLPERERHAARRKSGRLLGRWRTSACRGRAIGFRALRRQIPRRAVGATHLSGATSRGESASAPRSTTPRRTTALGTEAVPTTPCAKAARSTSGSEHVVHREPGQHDADQPGRTRIARRPEEHGPSRAARPPRSGAGSPQCRVRQHQRRRAWRRARAGSRSR